MHSKRKTDLRAVLADPGSLAEDLNSRVDTVTRLRTCFDGIEDDVVTGQRRRISEWPEWMVREMAP
jgi:hypothetical protein